MVTIEYTDANEKAHSLLIYPSDENDNKKSTSYPYRVIKKIKWNVGYNGEKVEIIKIITDTDTIEIKGSGLESLSQELNKAGVMLIAKGELDEINIKSISINALQR